MSLSALIPGSVASCEKEHFYYPLDGGGGGGFQEELSPSIKLAGTHLYT